MRPRLASGSERPGHRRAEPSRAEPSERALPSRAEAGRAAQSNPAQPTPEQRSRGRSAGFEAQTRQPQSSSWRSLERSWAGQLSLLEGGAERERRAAAAGVVMNAGFPREQRFSFGHRKWCLQRRRA
ncbi:hypothetical protein MUG91_G6n186 [Manis pentadactyla]|nr:hypothetical protein MUG91_G6n186 [Manis pentadactyla]